MFILAQGFGLLTISFFGFRFPAKQNMFFLATFGTVHDHNPENYKFLAYPFDQWNAIVAFLRNSLILFLLLFSANAWSAIRETTFIFEIFRASLILFSRGRRGEKSISLCWNFFLEVLNSALRLLVYLVKAVYV